MTASDFTREELTKYLFTDESLGTRPTAWYIGLFTGPDPSDEVDTGSDDANYVRQQATFVDYATTGRRRNDSLISFPAAETGASYEITHWGVFTAETGGDNLIIQPLEFSRQVDENNVVSFAQNDLIVGVGG